MAGEDVVCGHWAFAFPCLLFRDRIRKESGPRPRFDREIAKDRISALGVRQSMLSQQIGIGDHIVVEKQQDLAVCLSGAAIARIYGPAIFLLDDAKRDGAR